MNWFSRNSIFDYLVEREFFSVTFRILLYILITYHLQFSSVLHITKIYSTPFTRFTCAYLLLLQNYYHKHVLSLKRIDNPQGHWAWVNFMENQKSLLMILFMQYFSFNNLTRFFFAWKLITEPKVGKREHTSGTKRVWFLVRCKNQLNEIWCKKITQ